MRRRLALPLLALALVACGSEAAPPPKEPTRAEMEVEKRKRKKAEEEEAESARQDAEAERKNAEALKVAREADQRRARQETERRLVAEREADEARRTAATPPPPPPVPVPPPNTPAGRSIAIWAAWDRLSPQQRTWSALVDALKEAGEIAATSGSEEATLNLFNMIQARKRAAPMFTPGGTTVDDEAAVLIPSIDLSPEGFKACKKIGQAISQDAGKRKALQALDFRAIHCLQAKKSAVTGNLVDENEWTWNVPAARQPSTQARSPSLSRTGSKPVSTGPG